jgi:hypothetical protein
LFQFLPIALVIQVKGSKHVGKISHPLTNLPRNQEKPAAFQCWSIKKNCVRGIGGKCPILFSFSSGSQQLVWIERPKPQGWFVSWQFPD